MLDNSFDDLRLWQPLPYDTLCTKYSINLRTGEVVDLETLTLVTTETDENNSMYINLIDTSGTQVKAPIDELLVRVLYGPTRSKSIRPVTEIPCDTTRVTPRIDELSRKDWWTIVINGVPYRRWGNSYYFVSDAGCVFSEIMGQFFRIHYNKRGMGHISINTDEMKRSFKIASLVYEIFIGDIPSGMEIGFKDGRPWNAQRSNLELLSHTENLWRASPVFYNGLSKEALTNIVSDLNSGLSVSSVAEKHGVTKETLWKLRSGTIYKNELAKYGLKIDPYTRDRPLTTEQVRWIRKKAKEGYPARLIVHELNMDISLQAIYAIIKYQSYKDVDPIKEDKK